ncbi:proline racemase family protein [Bacillus rubiinfantis]|uniref:proline racemase family protein n=1 Tax=Bacillus rubiinfantis TaxID=1499680 RepID=UPI0005AAD1E7|nr:proline racemase family protein [Bacillus rubiinfantis]
MRLEKTYSTVDVHVAGEVFRILQNTPLLHYQTLEELNGQFTVNCKEEINLLLKEPRGFSGLNGCLVVPPINRQADAAVVFFNHEGTIPVHYGGITAVITALLECGELKIRDSNTYTIETLQGMISVTANMVEGEVTAVTVESCTCHLLDSDLPLNIDEERATFTLVETDGLYAVFEKKDLSINLEIAELAQIQKWGSMILGVLKEKYPVKGVILADESLVEKGRIKTVTFRPDGYIVRSPGFGTTLAGFTSALAKGRILADAPLFNESIFGSELMISKVKQADAGYRFTLSSRGFITALGTYVLDPTDPLASGFLIK